MSGATDPVHRGLWHRPLEKRTESLPAYPSLHTPLTKEQKMIAGMAFNLLCLFIRWVFSALLAIYRVTELKEGIRGRIIQTEVYFSVSSCPILPLLFDLSSPSVLHGGMITLAIFTLNVAHPGFLLYRVSEEERRERKELDAEGDVKGLDV
ncbi:hypothetical protein C8R45DRAFT_1136695 [Mycena sanguinolenta]|nr:hypothetical protein C8R45DRAFT_1136695 [Mycena sanguinolenta]